MSEMRSCEAIVEFRLNSADQNEGIVLKPGDVFLFDGYRSKVTTLEGVERQFISPGLKNTEGEWFRAISVDKPLTLPASPQVSKSSVVEELKRSAQGTDVEESSPGGEGPKQNMNDLLAEYDRKTLKGSMIINSEAKIISDVSEPMSKTGSNKAEVSVEDSPKIKRAVISNEEKVVKETNYTNKSVEPSEPKVRKKMEIVFDGDREVVKKTTVPAVNKNDVKERDSNLESKPETIKQAEVVTQTNYDEDVDIDVGSSTQTKVTKVAQTSTKRSVKIQNQEEQTGVVVGKVRKTTGVQGTSDGFIVNTTVGSPGEMEVPEAKSSSNDSIVFGGDVDIGDILGEV